MQLMSMILKTTMKKVIKSVNHLLECQISAMVLCIAALVPSGWFLFQKFYRNNHLTGTVILFRSTKRVTFEVILLKCKFYPLQRRYEFFPNKLNLHKYGEYV